MTEPVGSLGEEAGRLLEALTAWVSGRAARTAEPPAGETPTDEAPPIAEFLERLRAVGAGSGSTCRVCPFCLLLARLQAVRPDTVEHLLDAGTALMAAVRSVLEAEERAWAARPATRVERIHVA